MSKASYAGWVAKLVKDLKYNMSHSADLGSLFV